MARKEHATSAPRARAIVDAARPLFRSRGYAAVSVDEIGAALGISGPAIYRHFAGKAAVLETIVREAVDALEEATSPGTAEGVLDALADVAVGPTGLGSALGADLRHLPDVMRQELEGRVDGALGEIARRLDRPDADGGRFLARALVAIAGAPSFYTVDLPPDPHRELVAAALRAAAAAPPLAASRTETVPTPRTTARPWLPRDEAVLAALPDLFAQHGGFGGITMEDLGAAAGLSGPSVYTYFAGKHDVAVRAVERTASWATSSLQQALGFSEDGADVVRRAMRDYVELSRRLPAFSTPLELDDATFDAATRERVAAFVLDYRELWATCARIARPSLAPDAAAALLWAAHAVVNSARTTPVGEVVPSDGALLELALTVFFA